MEACLRATHRHSLTAPQNRLADLTCRGPLTAATLRLGYHDEIGDTCSRGNRASRPMPPRSERGSVSLRAWGRPRFS